MAHENRPLHVPTPPGYRAGAQPGAAGYYSREFIRDPHRRANDRTQADIDRRQREGPTGPVPQALSPGGQLGGPGITPALPGAKVEKKHPEGLAQFYDDSYLRLLQGLQGGQDPTQLLQNALAEFKGSPQDLSDFMSNAAPFMASGLSNVPGFQHGQDFMNVENPMQAFGQGAGMIGQGAAQGLQGAQNQLGRAGLGRSSAMAGLAGRATQQASTQQAGLFTDLFQQTQARQTSNARSAFDQQRQIAQLALGQNMAPRANPDGGGPSQAGAALGGAMSGAGAGFAIGGPLGAGIGLGVGALSSLF
jgi:hypothetical protein